MPRRDKLKKRLEGIVSNRLSQGGITPANTRTFYVVKRDGASMAWIKLGTFPEMTVVEQAGKAAERTPV